MNDTFRNEDGSVGQLGPSRWDYRIRGSNPFPGLRDVRRLTSLHPGLTYVRAVGTEDPAHLSLSSSPKRMMLTSTRVEYSVPAAEENVISFGPGFSVGIAPIGFTVRM